MPQSGQPPTITLQNLHVYYWRKAELLAFCRERGIPTTGSKQALISRIEEFLTTGQLAPLEISRSPKRASGKMPEQLTRATVIAPHFRCSQELRALFEAEIGPQFHFNGVMRDFIKHGAGQTLQDAIAAWNQDQQAPKIEQALAPQFEYNRHIREFFKANPGATLAEAIRAWNKKKARRKLGIQERAVDEEGEAP